MKTLPSHTYACPVPYRPLTRGGGDPSCVWKHLPARSAGAWGLGGGGKSHYKVQTQPRCADPCPSPARGSRRQPRSALGPNELILANAAPPVARRAAGPARYRSGSVGPDKGRLSRRLHGLLKCSANSSYSMPGTRRQTAYQQGHGPSPACRRTLASLSPTRCPKRCEIKKKKQRTTAATGSPQLGRAGTRLSLLPPQQGRH